MKLTEIDPPIHHCLFVRKAGFSGFHNPCLGKLRMDLQLTSDKMKFQCPYPPVMKNREMDQRLEPNQWECDYQQGVGVDDHELDPTDGRET
jgi:hypothetical protein